MMVSDSQWHMRRVFSKDDARAARGELGANSRYVVNRGDTLLRIACQFDDLQMTGEAMDVSDNFDFTGVKDYDFRADPEKPFSIDEDKVSLAIVAAVIDPENQDLVLGPVTKPIYLTFK